MLQEVGNTTLSKCSQIYPRRRVKQTDDNYNNINNELHQPLILHRYHSSNIALELFTATTFGFYNIWILQQHGDNDDHYYLSNEQWWPDARWAGIISYFDVVCYGAWWCCMSQQPL
jgi:hypothetical protein